MRKIRNYDELVAVGDSESRRIVLDLAEATLQRLDSYRRITSIMWLDGDVLTIGERSWDLSRKRHVYLVGGGKAANHMAMAVDQVLGDRLTQGIVIVKIAEETDRFQRTEVHVGGHPIPNQAGYEASLKILELVDMAGPEDLFIGVISGGSSALMSCPIDGITLEDEGAATDVLLKSGAGIYEINAVRRHISQINGGMLAQRIAATGAEFIGFGISDAVGNPPTGNIGVPYTDYASTPIGPDKTTLADARRVIVDYDLVDRLPSSIVRYLMTVGVEGETPKSFPRNTYYLLNTVPDTMTYARQAAADAGLSALVLTSFLEGEARDVGTVLAAIAREIQAHGNPIAAPCVVLAAGEATTYIPDSTIIGGHGGPGHEVVAGFALSAEKAPGATLLSIDSEGTDGTTSAAGGIADSTTLRRADAADVNLRAALRSHSCHEALGAVGDVVVTGNTGTNLCDLNILYVPEAR